VNREEICYKIREVGVIPSVRVKSADLALFAVEFIAAGGIPIAEIAATIPGSTALIADIRQRFPAVITGAEALSLREVPHRARLPAGDRRLLPPARLRLHPRRAHPYGNSRRAPIRR